MRLAARLSALVRNLFGARRVERDIDDELAAMYGLIVEEQLQAGLTPAQADRAARLELGGTQQIKEDVQDARLGSRLESLGKDARYALRGLLRRPGFTVVTILTLTLGIGANSAIFSAVHAVLLRALPYGDPDRLVMVWEDASAINFPKNTPAPGNYAEWVRNNHVFSAMAATRSQLANLTADGPPEQILGRAVTANFFSVLGVRLLIGRTFTDEEDRVGAPVVVISHRLWRQRYNSDAAIVGRDILMNGSKRTVIGVMPAGFTFRNREMDFWTRINFSPADLQNHNFHNLNVVARLRPDASLQQARDDMNAIGRQLAADYPDTNRLTPEVVVEPLAEDILGNSRLELIVLMGAAVSVLLIACANLASLLLSQGVARRGELSLRLALGASNGRIIQQMIVEAMLLAVTGGLLGLMLAPAGVKLLAGLIPSSLPEVSPAVLNVPLLAFTAIVAVSTGFVFSLVPAIIALRASDRGVIPDVGRTTSGGGHRAAQDTLVVVQVAMALVLLAGAGLMFRTMANLRALDLGFRPDHLLTMRTTLARERYANPANRLAYFERVVNEAKLLPGVQRAAFVSVLPFVERGNTSGYVIEGEQPRRDDDALFRVATSGYLSLIDVRLVEGRLLGEQDGPDAPRVVVVNETLARRHWPAASPLGHRMSFEGPDGPWRTIVGVVRDVRERGYLPELKPGAYLPYGQILDTWAMPQYLIARTNGDPSSMVASFRGAIARVDSEQPVTAIRTMDDIIDLDVADRQQHLQLLGIFAVLALVLAALGLYGVLSYSVAQRRREIGLRIALGASVRTVLRLVVLRGIGLAVIGMSAGVLVAIVSTGVLEALLFGVKATDTGTFAFAIAVLAAVALGASILPALRAARVDPMTVLRQD